MSLSEGKWEDMYTYVCAHPPTQQRKSNLLLYLLQNEPPSPADGEGSFLSFSLEYSQIFWLRIKRICIDQQPAYDRTSR